MRYVLYGLLGLICLLIAGMTFVFVAAPTGYIQDRMVQAVRQATGRNLVVAGGTSFTLYPMIGVTLRDVTLSGPPGMEDEDFASMRSLDVAIPLLPLLQRRLAVERFVLVEPVFTLKTDAAGRRSWDFSSGADQNEGAASASGEALRGTVGEGAANQDPDDQNAADAAQSGSEGAVGPLAHLSGLSLGDVRIEKGIVRIIDERAGTQQEASDIDVVLDLADIAAPLTATGSLVWRGRKLPFKATVGSPADILEGRATTLQLALDAAGMTAGFDGRIALGSATALDGRVTAELESLAETMRWTGSEPPPVGGLGPLSLEADLAVNDKTVALRKARLTLDGATAQGTVTLDTSGPRLAIETELALDRLDLNVYLGDDEQDAAAGETDSTATEAAVSKKTASSGKTSAKAAETSQTPGAGWSREPIDFSGLTAVDAEAKLTVASLRYRQIEVGKSSLVVSLRNGFLKARFPQIALYEGEGVGTIALDSRQKSPKIDANFTVKGISTLPLLTDAAGFDWVAGRGDLSIGFTGAGASQHDIIASLLGQGRFLFRDGAIVGINIPAMARNLLKGNLSGWQRDEAQKTDFSELSGTFSIDKGIATNKDLLLVGPLLRLTGAGSADLPRQRLDYLANPKVVASLEGQGGDVEANGVGVPVRITGPWSDPKLTPDLDALLADPKGALNAAKDLAGKVKGGDKLKKALEEQLANNPDAASALEQLLGGKKKKKAVAPEETGTTQ